MFFCLRPRLAISYFVVQLADKEKLHNSILGSPVFQICMKLNGFSATSLHHEHILQVHSVHSVKPLLQLMY